MLPTWWIPPADGQVNWGLVPEHLDMVARGEAVLPLGNLFFGYAREPDKKRFAQFMRSKEAPYGYVSLNQALFLFLSLQGSFHRRIASTHVN